MKKTVLLLFLVLTKFAFTQVTDTIEVNFYRSVYLYFKEAPSLTDAGSEDLSVRLVDNKVILQVLNGEDFSETSLFVESQGIPYYFFIRYSENPKKYVFNYPKLESKSTNVGDFAYEQKKSDSITKIKKDSLLISNCEILMQRENRIFNKGVKKYKMGFFLRDIVVQDELMYLKIQVTNKSKILFRKDFEAVEILNIKSRIKNTGEQNIRLSPIYIYNQPKEFLGESSYTYVVVIPKFVLTEEKKATFKLWELNGSDLTEEGGRKLNFDIFYRDILITNNF